MGMTSTLHGCNRVRVSQLAVTISRAHGEADDYEVCLHSTDPDFALHLAEALVAAHHRRIGYAGVCAIVSEPRGRWQTQDYEVTL